jgi:fluoride exporter
MTLFNVLLVGAGGCIGSIARYLTVLSVDRRINGVFPCGTFAVNVVGSFILGLLLAWTTLKSDSHSFQWRLFLGTGFCGGFTTFSAFAVENVSLLEKNFPGTALLYISTSLIAGLLAVWAGFSLARAIL